MVNPIQLEDAYQDFSKNLRRHAPDGVVDVGLFLLYELGLLEATGLETESVDNLTQYFHVIETNDKVTLFNEQFAIWIVPSPDDTSSTLTYIALVQDEKPHLEIVYTTNGIYNTPRHILKVLQYYLTEVLDTEAAISSIGKQK